MTRLGLTSMRERMKLFKFLSPFITRSPAWTCSRDGDRNHDLKLSQARHTTKAISVIKKMREMCAADLKQEPLRERFLGNVGMRKAGCDTPLLPEAFRCFRAADQVFSYDLYSDTSFQRRICSRIHCAHSPAAPSAASGDTAL